MFAKNVGSLDRIIRAIVGVACIVAFFSMSGGLAWLLGVVGAVMILTAALGSCPPYALLGINTCKVKS
jgi:ABC-type glucose/galactose transport system permease subunit